MGQKVRPTGFRTGIMVDWQSRWYANKADFAELLVEDFKLRAYIKKHYSEAGISHMKIERTREKAVVFVYAARVGVIIGKQGGINGELNIGKLLSKRAHIIGTTLRGRPTYGPGSKSEVVAEVTRSVWPMIADGRVRPIIGARLPIQDAAEAHRLLSSGQVTGKIVLTV